MQTFDPYALEPGTHRGEDPRYPHQVYVVSEHRGVPIVAEYDERDLETETAYSARLCGEIIEAANGEDINDLTGIIDERLDTEEPDAFAMLGVPRL
jgi:hypothetical protein